MVLRNRRRDVLNGVVLPRFLRRPARTLERLAGRRMPWRLGAGLAALLVMIVVASFLSGGQGTAVLSALPVWSGLAIEEVIITGQSETSEVDVLDQLAIGDAPSLLTFDVEAAKARIEALPWVAEATLTKLYPNRLTVTIDERVPFAIWQHAGRTSLVDHAGAVIADGVGSRYTNLPMVAGDGAAQRVTEFTNLISAFPDLAWRVRAGAWVGERRWTVVLENDVTLMLPETDPAAALQRISELDANNGLLARAIAVVDLRVADRLVIRLSEAGVAARQLLLRDRNAAGTRRGTST